MLHSASARARSALAPVALVFACSLACSLASVSAHSEERAALPAAADGGASAPATTLQTVVVKGQAVPGSSQPYSTTSLDAQQIRDAAVNQPEELLRKVPGVEVRGYHLGGVVNVITIRGFNGGAHGGDLGMVLDGIPLNEAMSHADGYADLNVVVPLEIAGFDVFRGPVSALYGNFNRGGVIAINTRRDSDYREFDASIGSFGTYDAQGAVGAGWGPGVFNGAAQYDLTNGYRPDSRFQRGTLAGRYTLDLGSAAQLSLSARGHKSSWDSASYLPLAQFRAGDPYGKDPRENGDGGSKNFHTGRADFNYLLTGELKLLSFVHGTRQDYTRFFSRPLDARTYSQREETYHRDVFGAGFSLNGDHRFGGARLDYVAGVEHHGETTNYLFYEGTVARSRTAQAGYDRKYAFDSDSAFGQGELVIASWLRPTLGVRYDRFTGDCTKNGSETGTDPCSALNTAHRTTPKVGIRSTVLTGLDLRASQAEGFALPPGVAKYAPGGNALDPTVFKQTEVGLNYKAGPFSADLAAYRLTSTNEVRTVSPGVYENFGHTRRTGFEAAVSVTPAPAVELALLYNHMNAKVTGNFDPALVGKRITGVPRSSATITASYRPETGFGAFAEAHKASDSAVDAANTLFYGAYTTFDLGVQYAGKSNDSRYRAYLRVDNATDRVHASNAFIIGGQPLVAPAPPRGVKAGVQLGF